MSASATPGRVRKQTLPVDSALAGVSESVAERLGMTPPIQPPPPDPPTAPRQPPKLRLIDGGRRGGGRQNQRDGRKPVENAPATSPKDGKRWHK
jgi:hypothetical protein